MDDILAQVLSPIVQVFLPWLVNCIASYPGYFALAGVLYAVGQVLAFAARVRYPEYKDRPEFFKWLVIIADVLSITPSTMIKYFKKDPNPPLSLRLP